MAKVTRKARKIIFIGCEGESERSYGKFLHDLAEQHGCNIQILAFIPKSTGNSLMIAKGSIKEASRRVDKGVSKFVLFDYDKAIEIPRQAEVAEAELRKSGFIPIWQHPDHEGLLLRHFEAHRNSDPRSGETFNRLRSVWPDYQKNMNAANIQKKLALHHVLCAASVNPSFKMLIEAIGLDRVEA